MTPIEIHLKWNGLNGFAECETTYGSFFEMGRTQAEALSKCTSKMAKVPALLGCDYVCRDVGVSGKIGDSTKRRKRRSISEMDTFQLVGGMMHDPKEKQ